MDRRRFTTSLCGLLFVAPRAYGQARRKVFQVGFPAIASQSTVQLFKDAKPAALPIEQPTNRLQV